MHVSSEFTRSMSDLDGPEVAKEIYSKIIMNCDLDLDMIPYAIDAAVSALRERGLHASRWATYVHVGV